MNPRPEIVLPPGFALRIDYDPTGSPASLRITAYRGGAPVGQAYVDPREVGQRLRLEIAPAEASGTGHDAAAEPRLRLAPQRAMKAIEMSAVRAPAPQREVLVRSRSDSPEATPAPKSDPATSALSERIHSTEPAATAALHRIAREVQPDSWWEDERSAHATNALAWLANGTVVVLPALIQPRRPLTLVARITALVRELRSGALQLVDDARSNRLRVRLLDP